jgi:DNA topoisomerase-1
MSDCEARATSAGLIYIQEFGIGFSRKKSGKGFKYIDHDGKVITCKNIRKWITDLVIPPAWKDVWINHNTEGHILATGIDEAGRKQYIYHPSWHEASAAHKYGRLKAFAKILPTIRKNVQSDLRSDDLSKRRVVAAVVRLLDKACIRIGNKQYLEANDSRGATTLTSEHVCRNKHGFTLDFIGKSGKQVKLECHDDELAAVIADCEKSDGEFLFSYQNSHGEFVAVTSSDVNSYLLEVARDTVTAKDFRTWRGSLVAFSHLSKMQPGLSETAKKRYIADAVRAAAAALNNTPAVCRRSYIHSGIINAAQAGVITNMISRMDATVRRRAGLTQNEIRLMAFLHHLEEHGDEIAAAVKSAGEKAPRKAAVKKAA